MNITLRHFLLLCALLAMGSRAQADNADLDEPGPTGRSWVGLDGSYDRDQADSFGETTRSTGRTLGVFGSFSPSEQWSLNFSASRTRYRFTSSDGFAASDSSNSATIGLAVRTVGTATSTGFGLVVGGSAGHTEGNGNAFSVYLQPRYRLNDTSTAVLLVGLARDNEDLRAQYAQFSWLWKATSDLSIVPSVSWSHVDSRGGYPSDRTTGVSLDAIYHLDRHLSFLASVYTTRSPDIDVGYSITNRRGQGGSLGVRWTF